MGTPYKMKGSPMQRNFGIGVSPMKNDKTATGGDPKLEKLKAKRVANTKAGKIIKFGEGSNIIADKGPIDPWSSEVKKTAKKPANFNMKGGKTTTPGFSTTKIGKAANKAGKVAKKVAGKAGKFLGGKALGVAGMLMATSSKADQPTKGKGKIDFSKQK